MFEELIPCNLSFRCSCTLAPHDGMHFDPDDFDQECHEQELCEGTVLEKKQGIQDELEKGQWCQDESCKQPKTFGTQNRKTHFELFHLTI